MKPLKPFLVDVETGRKLVGLGRTAMWTKVSSGEIPSCLVGRRRLLSVELLEKWAQERFSVAAD